MQKGVLFWGYPPPQVATCRLKVRMSTTVNCPQIQGTPVQLDLCHQPATTYSAN